jgi:hypothetical protein
MQFLKQSTSVKVVIGPFVDETDSKTPETGITLGAADHAEIIKHDSGSVVDIASNTWAAITSADGLYNLTLSTTDTNTPGMLTVYVADTSVCLPVKQNFMVLPGAIYDALVGGTDTLEVDVVAISGDATAADNLEAGAEALVSSTCSTGSTTTTIVTNLTEGTDDHYNGRTVIFTTGTLAGQSASITDYNGTTKTLTVSTMTEAPSNADAFVIS